MDADELVIILKTVVLVAKILNAITDSPSVKILAPQSFVRHTVANGFIIMYVYNLILKLTKIFITIIYGP